MVPELIYNTKTPPSIPSAVPPVSNLEIILLTRLLADEKQWHSSNYIRKEGLARMLEAELSRVGHLSITTGC